MKYITINNNNCLITKQSVCVVYMQIQTRVGDPAIINSRGYSILRILLLICLLINCCRARSFSRSESEGPPTLSGRRTKLLRLPAVEIDSNGRVYTCTCAPVDLVIAEYFAIRGLEGAFLERATATRPCRSRRLVVPRVP